jgi:hypothetical protein
MVELKDAIIAASKKFPKPANAIFQYGTAGVSLLLSVDNYSLGLANNLLVTVPHESVCNH